MAPKSERQFVKKITLKAQVAQKAQAYLNISCVKARIYLCGLVKSTTDTLSITALDGNRLRLRFGLQLAIRLSAQFVVLLFFN
jgi:hypothetical protein